MQMTTFVNCYYASVRIRKRDIREVGLVSNNFAHAQAAPAVLSLAIVHGHVISTKSILNKINAFLYNLLYSEKILGIIIHMHACTYTNLCYCHGRGKLLHMTPCRGFFPWTN